MRKLFLALVVLALSFAVVAPATVTRAQEAKTLLEIVAGNPDFSTLAAAVGAADPLFAAALGNKEISLTVFAPTNDAFAALLTALDVKAEDLLKNTALLNSVLAYHVVPGVYRSAAVAELNDVYLGTALADDGVNADGVIVSALKVAVADGKVSLTTSSGGTANITAVDVEAANGIGHVIDAVLIPGKNAVEADPAATPEASVPASIAGTVALLAKGDKPEFTTLLAAVTAADPGVAAILDKEGPLTVFAPTDAGFEAALKELNLTVEQLVEDKAALSRILGYHVVSGQYKAATIVGAAANGPFKIASAVGGLWLEISVVDGKVLVNGVAVVAADVKATNGYIHAISGVLIPPAAK